MSSEAGRDVFLQVLRLRERCRAKRSAAEDDQLIAAAAADRQRLEAARARRQQIESARDSDAWLKKQRDRALADEEAQLADGKVEVRIAPGTRWTLQWFEDFVAQRLPDLDPRNLDPNIGVLALLFGLQRLEDRIARGKRPGSSAGFVVGEARAVMAGKRTMWVTQAEADRTPNLVVRDNTRTYVGKLWQAWEQRSEDLQHNPDMRRARGLL